MYHWIVRFALGSLVLGLSDSMGAGAFFGDPPDDVHPWAVHDQNRPQPTSVKPGKAYGDAPSDAIFLFDGSPKSLDQWKHSNPDEKRKGDWFVEDGILHCFPGSGDLFSAAVFGDCQVHIEWAAPTPVKGVGQGRGNSGVFLMGMVEVQILDSYQNPTYADGFAGAVYGVMPPAVNALRPSGEWQSYDIIFRRPIVRDGEVLDPGSLTVLCNGIVVQDSTVLEGGGGWKKRKALNREFPKEGPLLLQDHGNSVRFRNIWYRPLRPRSLDGGTDGSISPAATLKKRSEIARDLREDASLKEGVERALRLYESLVYAPNSATQEEADWIIQTYLQNFQTAKPRDLASEKATIIRLLSAFEYMNKWSILPADHFALPIIEDIVESQDWKLKKN